MLDYLVVATGCFAGCLLSDLKFADDCKSFWLGTLGSLIYSVLWVITIPATLILFFYLYLFRSGELADFIPTGNYNPITNFLRIKTLCSKN